MSVLSIEARPLIATAFQPYGDVIQTTGAEHFAINGGAIERYHALARVDAGVGEEACPIISIACCNRVTTSPAPIRFVERHPLGSQAFFPLDDTPLVVAVAPPGETVDPGAIEVFVSDGTQGINYARGVWHVPLIALSSTQRFLVVDRGGPGPNCEEFHFEGEDIRMVF